MKEKIRVEVLKRLERDYELKHMTGTNYMRKGKCPAHSCGKKTLYTFHDSPWMLICGRPEKCGHRVHVKDIYDDLFNEWSKTAPSTVENPTATARAYLEFARGFRLELIEGWYSQETYWSRDHNAVSATVRFALEKGGYWERLIDRPERFGKQKARFKPGESYKGVWWCPPSVDLLEVDELWINEGIFDAIALLHHDITAVSMMSSAPFPIESLKALIKLRQEAGQRLPKLVWALDNEPVARANVRRYAKEATELGFTCEAAMIPQRGRKVDWNDLHQRWTFIEGDDERAKRIQNDLDEARHEGALLLADTAEEKGLLMYDWKPKAEFSFSFKNKLYWFKFDLEKYDRTIRELESSDKHDDQLLSDRQRRDKALRQCGAVVRIASCYFQALYYMRNDVTDEAWYYFRIERPDGPAIKSTFTAPQLTSMPEFKKRLLHVSNGSMYTGNSMQLERMLEPQLDRLKTVNTIDWIGYSREHGAYVFNDIAIANGKVYKLNEEDFFEVGPLSIKSQSQSPVLQINTDLNSYNEGWFDVFWRCFGVRGTVVLTWWLGALHAEQIRQLQKSYLFLELVGEAGSGKTTLVELLWKLVGRTEYEGFDPSKATPASRARNFAQVGNLPVVLIESEREQKDGQPVKHFDWDELKTAYNGRSVRSTGVKNNGNDTREPPFRAALLIAQNNPVNASEPILQRLGHVHLTREHQTPETKLLAEQLERMPIENLSGFLIKAMQREPEIVKLLDERTSGYEQELLAIPGIRTVRIAKNHAQLRSLVDALALVVPLGAERAALVHAEIAHMAEERQQAINADHPTVREFWDLFEFLDGMGDGDVGSLNHSRKPGFIAVNLNEFVETAANKRQQVPPISELKRLLKTSKAPKFLESNKAINSARKTDAFSPNKTVRCWLFQQV
ncbi:bifunctional DNA primase/helicase [Pseudomonas sp. 09C 129]|uniref:toprim domain-containing protein n=1 Tax=Pseudomonas sp. 09C 129 TaxID=2054915 RepID=UPI000C6DADAE|nr:toprim domain-containing protein [Pseudomonas sp. 09C 129]AUG04859.1 bifunctional DNA primase/helicase [Pseudomonas sp. 09C 129]